VTAWVLHVDLDQYVAAVEVLRRPELRGKPVVVGGRGDPTERGVVSTASYEAREFGVRSGMPLRTAAKKCPDAIFLPVDAAAYDEMSARVMDALRSLDFPVEVLGWDEAFMGVEVEDPEAFAASVQQTVLDATELHCSVGIGDNKIRAKIATEFGKPRGMFRLTAENWYEVMGERPTEALWGIGAKTAKRLAEHGIHTVNELARSDPRELASKLGPTLGPWYVQLGRGLDNTPVNPNPYVPRGHGRETTFQHNVSDWDQIQSELARLAAQVTDDIAAEGRPAVRVEIKVRYAPFITITRSRKLPAATSKPNEIAAAVAALGEKLDRDRAIRLLGVRLEMTEPD